jgi:dihydrofolate reductase
VLVAGSATRVQALHQYGLVDEYRLMIHPVVLGAGKRLFRDGSVPSDLELIDTRKVGPNVIVLSYRPAEPPAAAS